LRKPALAINEESCFSVVQAAKHDIHVTKDSGAEFPDHVAVEPINTNIVRQGEFTSADSRGFRLDFAFVFSSK